MQVCCMCSTGLSRGVVGSQVDSRSTPSSNTWASKGTVFEFNTAGINRGNRAGDFRQLVVSILLHTSRLQIVIMEIHTL